MSTDVPFVKLHVCGNDFIFIEPGEGVSESSLGDIARHACERKNGIGADQLVGISRISKQEVRLRIMNPDGSLSSFCGNACIASALYSKDRWSMEGDILLRLPYFSTMVITDKGSWWVRVKTPKAIYNPNLSLKQYFTDCWYIDNGTEHLVVLCKNIENIDVLEWSQKLQNYLALGRDVNVMFVGNVSENRFMLLPWERGGTGISQACGSGACASAFVLQWLYSKAVNEYIALCPGGELRIRTDPAKGDWLVTGTPAISFRGNIKLQAR